MRKRLALLALSLTATLSLTGCVAPDAEVEVSTACASALATFQDAEPLTDEETQAVRAMAEGCGTVAEFTAGVIANPESWGYNDGDNIEYYVIATCLDNATAPLCVDAAEQGIDFTVD